MTDLAVPTVHLNGTSGGELMLQLTTAINAVLKAQEALCAAAPHGRDYYVKDDSEFYKARSEHHSRLVRLDTVRRELEDIAWKVSGQLVERKSK